MGVSLSSLRGFLDGRRAAGKPRADFSPPSRIAASRLAGDTSPHSARGGAAALHPACGGKCRERGASAPTCDDWGVLQARASTRQPLVPPKPKLLDITVSS